MQTKPAGPAPSAVYRAEELAEIRQPLSRIRPYAHRTPVMTSGRPGCAGRAALLQVQNLQRVEAFKFGPATPSSR